MKNKEKNIMRKTIETILWMYEKGHTDLECATNQILFYLDDNTGGVSNDSDESSVLHGVGESHASEPTDKANQSFDDGTLEKITRSGNTFFCRGTQMRKVIPKSKWADCKEQCDTCKKLMEE